MAGNARFHDKLHRKNHHTNPTVGFADSASDPIASPSEPFQGDFVVNGKLSASSGIEVLSANISGDIYCNNIHVSSVTYTNWISGNSTETIISDGTLTGHGNNTLTLDYQNGIYGKSPFFSISNTLCSLGIITSPSATFDTLTVKTSTNLTGPLSVFGDTNLNGTLTVTGSSTINGKLSVDSDVNINGNLLVTGNISALGDTTQIDTTIVTTSAIIIDTFGTTDALRVTQRGTGNAILVEDDTNPDSTPFVVTSVGNVGIGTTTPNERLTIDKNIGFEGTSAHYIKSSYGIDDNGFVVFGGTTTGTNSYFIHPFYSLSSWKGGAIYADRSLDTILPYQERKIVYGSEQVTRYFLVSGTASNPLEVAADANIASIRAFAYSGDNKFNTLGGGGNASIDLKASGNQTLTNGGGYIVFATMPMNSGTSTGAFERMRITSEGKVGIGTIAPDVNLTVAGTDVSQVKVSASDNGVDCRLTAIAGVGNAGIVGTYSTHPFTINTDATERLRIDGSGNVGIGTTTPTEKLHVDGNVLITGNLSAMGDTFQIDTTIVTTSAMIIDTFGTTDALRVTQRGTGNAILVEDDTNPDSSAFVINSAGNVGIGTTTPTEKLHVDGNTIIIATDFITEKGALTLVKPTSTYGTNDIEVKTYGYAFKGIQGTAGGLKIRTAGGTYSSPTATLSGRVGYLMGSGTHDGVTWKNSSAITLGIESDATIDNHNSYIAFETLFGGFTSSRKEKMRITSEGNVGIGLSNPDAPITVLANTAAYAQIFRGRPSDGASLLSFKSNDNITERAKIEIQGDGNLKLNVLSGSTLFALSGVERMRIDTSGNVGIGTTTPRSKLDMGANVIAGVANIRGFSNSGAYSMWGGLGADSILDGGYIQVYGSTHVTNPYLVTLGNSNAGTIVAIASGGNVGIGTLSPNKELTVVGDISAVGVIHSKDITLNRGNTQQEGGQIIFNRSYDNANAFAIDVYSDNIGSLNSRLRIIDILANVERMTILSSGNVGIGVGNPNSTLHVNGDITLPGKTLLGSITGSTNGAVGIAGGNTFLNGSGGAIAVRGLTNTFNGGGIEFYYGNGTSTIEAMRIVSGGNVGIGTANPISKLHVNGDITLENGRYLNLDTNNGGGNTAIRRNTGQNGMEFFTQSASRMFIADTGNVGIGTLYPTSKLHLSGSINDSVTLLLETDSSSQETSIDFVCNSTGGRRWRLGTGGSSGGYANGSIGFYDVTSGSMKMLIASSGNVGIGNNIYPTEELHVSKTQAGSQTVIKVQNPSTANNSQARFDMATGTPNAYSVLYVGENSTSGPYTAWEQGEGLIGGTYIRAASAAPIYIGHATANRVTILSGGNVGIGIDNPLANLHVVGTTTLDGTVTVGRQDNSAEGGEIRLCRALDNASEWVIDSRGVGVGNRLRFHKDLGGEKMTILDNGNVGIGIAGPNTKLYVAGGTLITDLSGTGNRAVYSDGNGLLTNTSSDGTLKEIISSISQGLNEVLQLNPVSFNWKDTEKRGTQREIGFIAQEVQPIIPEVIGENANGTLSLDYPKMIAVLTKAIQELNDKVEAQAAEITSLKAKIK